MENPNAVEQPVEKAQEELKPEVIEPVAPVPGDENDNVVLTKAQAEELVKAAEEATKLAEKKSQDAENYQRGMMKYKRQLEDNGFDTEEKEATTTEQIAEMVKNAVAEAITQVIPKPEVDPLTKANQTISELKNMIINRPPTSSSAGTNMDKDQPIKSEAEKYFSAEQIAEMKRMSPGIDINEVYKNLPKNRDMQGAPNA